MLPIGLVLIAIGIYSMKVVKKAEHKQQLDISSLTEAKLYPTLATTFATSSY